VNQLLQKAARMLPAVRQTPTSSVNQIIRPGIQAFDQLTMVLG